MLVVDASAVTELVLRRTAAAAVERHLARDIDALHAPHLLDIEVLSALRRIVAVGEASPERAERALADFLDLPLTRHAHSVLAPRIWTLRNNLSAYDAAYVSLAEILAEADGALLTADGRLARAAAKHSDAEVVLVS